LEVKFFEGPVSLRHCHQWVEVHTNHSIGRVLSVLSALRRNEEDNHEQVHFAHRLHKNRL